MSQYAYYYIRFVIANVEKLRTQHQISKQKCQCNTELVVLRVKRLEQGGGNTTTYP